MFKREWLEAEINKLPDDLGDVKAAMRFLLDADELNTLRAYVSGAFSMAAALTSDDSVLTPLAEIREILTW